MSSIVQYLPETLSVTMRVLDGPEKKMTLVRKPGVVVAKGLLLRQENGRELYLLHAFNHYVTHNHVRDGYREYPRDSFEVLRFLFVEGQEHSLERLVQGMTSEEVAKIGSPAPAPVAAEATPIATTNTLSVPPLPSPPLPSLSFQEKLRRLPTQIPVNLRVGTVAEKFGMLRIRLDSSQQPLLEIDYTPVRVFFNDYLNDYLKTCDSEAAKAAFWGTDMEMLEYFFVEHPVKASLGSLLETGDVEVLRWVGIVPVPEPPKPILMKDLSDEEMIRLMETTEAEVEAEKASAASAASAATAVVAPPVAAPATAAAVAPATENIKLTLSDHFRNIEKANVKRLQYRVPAKLSVDLEYDSNYATDIKVEMDGTFSLVTQAKKAYSGLNSLEVLHYLSYGTERSMLESKAMCDPFYGLNRLYYQGVRKSLGFYIRLKATRPASASASATDPLDVRARISLERKKSRRLHAELAEYTELEKQVTYNKGLEARLAALKASLA